jgi:hypothetical protein
MVIGLLVKNISLFLISSSLLILKIFKDLVIVLSIKNQRVFYSDDKLFLFLDDYPGICMN